MRRRTRIGLALSGVIAFWLVAGPPAPAHDPTPYPGTLVYHSPLSFQDFWSRFEDSVQTHGMRIVTRSSPSLRAASRGVEIPGNTMLGVFNDEFAERILKVNELAGADIPMRFYLVEETDGSAALIYRIPSAIFKLYDDPATDAIARELDPIVEAIVRDAIRG